jgi:ABC-type transport system involved in multi-copper enzyme maturation permease subunit
MSSLLRASWILFSAHLLRTLRSRRALFCMAMAIVPVGLAFVVSRLAELDASASDEVQIPYFLFLQVGVPLIALLLGSAVVSEEIDDRTVSYLLTRPIPRASILLGRYAASLAILVLILGVSAGLTGHFLGGLRTRGGARLVPEDFGRTFTLVAVTGGAVYAAIYAAIGAWLKWPVIVGLGYTVAFELFLANIPGRSQSLSVQYYLKSWLFGGDVSRMSHADFLTTPLLPPAEAIRSLVLIGIAALAIGSWILSKRQFLLPS